MRDASSIPNDATQSRLMPLALRLSPRAGGKHQVELLGWMIVLGVLLVGTKNRYPHLESIAVQECARSNDEAFGVIIGKRRGELVYFIAFRPVETRKYRCQELRQMLDIQYLGADRSVGLQVL